MVRNLDPYNLNDLHSQI